MESWHKKRIPAMEGGFIYYLYPEQRLVYAASCYESKNLKYYFITKEEVGNVKSKY